MGPTRWGLGALTTALVLTASAGAHAYEPLYDNLNEIERLHVDAILEAEGLQHAASPEGKRFGEVRVVPLEVFLDDSAWLRWANIFHATTRDWIIEDEVLWEPGAVFDSELVEETVRNLRLSPNLSVVAMVPVESADAGVVDILAVTRDTWSLRLNAELDLTDSVINSLFVSLTERNLAGAHKQVALIGIWEQDTISLGPRYIDPRIFRSRLALTEELLFAINHDNGDLEGTVNTFELGLPLYSLTSRWGFSLTESHSILVERLFVGDQVRLWENPEAPDAEPVPFEIDTTQIDVRALVRRGFGRTPRHVVSFGYGLSINDFDLAARGVEPAQAAAFEAANLPRDETSSFVTSGWRFFSGRFETVRNYQTYGFTEDLAVGHDVGVEVRVGPRFMGSDTDFARWSAFAAYTWVIPTSDEPGAQLDGAVLSAEVELGARLEIERGDWIDELLFARARAASPPVGPFRFHAGGRLFVKLDRETTSLVELGGSNGLRGYASGAFIGDSLAVGHLEVRTCPVQIWTFRLGGLVFFDAGTIWFEGEPAPFLSDVGLGARLVVPTAQRFAYRFDYAFPTSGPSSFFPGTLTVGVEQVF